ncbi:MAG TPA: GNAT family N-acetyltransferase [Mycobacteriales bacterium]
MADVAVRAARPADVPEIARIQVDTWRTAYTRFLPESVLAALDVTAAAQAWEAAVVSPPSPEHHVLVATEGSYTVGFVAVGPSGEEDARPGEAEVAALLVEPRWGRRGHGSRLLAAAVDYLRQDGMTGLVAWVPDGDRASTAFYESAGWEPDGTARILEADGGSVRETRWHVALEGS